MRMLAKMPEHRPALDEVESCLRTHARVVEGAVVGAPDADGLVKPVAFVVASSPDADLADELQHWVLDRLEPALSPATVG